MATEDNVPTLDEEAIYAEALSELKSGTVRPGLWAKAFAESEGDENKSQALYMRLRVQHEKDRRQQLQNAAAASAADAVRRKAEEFSAMIEQLRLKGYDARKSGNGWIVREPLGGRAKLDSDKSLSEYAEGRISVASRRHDSSDKHVASLWQLPPLDFCGSDLAPCCDCQGDYASKRLARIRHESRHPIGYACAGSWQCLPAVGHSPGERGEDHQRMHAVPDGQWSLSKHDGRIGPEISGFGSAGEVHARVGRIQLLGARWPAQVDVGEYPAPTLLRYTVCRFQATIQRDCA